jgi:SAM-dependent methyltransferase
VAFAEDEKVIQTLAPDRADESLRDGIAAGGGRAGALPGCIDSDRTFSAPAPLRGGAISRPIRQRSCRLRKRQPTRGLRPPSASRRGNLYGVDCMPLAIELCRETNPWSRFALIPPLPPADLPSSHFDLVYLYSVFSHLSEDAQDQWLTEFSRVLRPGGVLIATTWPREYIERCERARHGDTRGTHPGSIPAFIGTAEWLARYDNDEYCHSAVGGGPALPSTFYGETCIPEGYVRRRWRDRFVFREFISDANRCLQSVIVVQKPG